VKKNRIKILGREYLLQSDINEEQLEKTKKEIEEKIHYFEKQYPTVDKIDLLVLFIFDLLERIYIKDRQLHEMQEKLENVKIKVERIENKIKEKINNLTKEE